MHTQYGGAGGVLLQGAASDSQGYTVAKAKHDWLYCIPVMAGFPTKHALSLKHWLVRILIVQAIACGLRFWILSDWVGGFWMAVVISLGAHAYWETMNNTYICCWGIACIVCGFIDLLSAILPVLIGVFKLQVVEIIVRCVIPFAYFLGAAFAYHLYLDFAETNKFETPYSTNFVPDVFMKMKAKVDEEHIEEKLPFHSEGPEVPMGTEGALPPASREVNLSDAGATEKGSGGWFGGAFGGQHQQQGHQYMQQGQQYQQQYQQQAQQYMQRAQENMQQEQQYPQQGQQPVGSAESGFEKFIHDVGSSCGCGVNFGQSTPQAQDDSPPGSGWLGGAFGEQRQQVQQQGQQNAQQFQEQVQQYQQQGQRNAQQYQQQGQQAVGSAKSGLGQWMQELGTSVGTAFGQAAAQGAVDQATGTFQQSQQSQQYGATRQ